MQIVRNIVFAAAVTYMAVVLVDRLGVAAPIVPSAPVVASYLEYHETSSVESVDLQDWEYTELRRRPPKCRGR